MKTITARRELSYFNNNIAFSGGARTISRPNVNNVLQENKTYKLFIDERVNWHKAYRYCDKMNMTLASFDNEQEYDQLVEKIKQDTSCAHDGGFWTAGYLTPEDGARWLMNQKPLKFAPWFPGQPTPDKRIRLVSLRPDYHYKLLAQFMSSLNYIACEIKNG
ncbi:hypothetical protein J6590_037592 [Homalodisca vitripennis]|nr:hypothetical protein J6590_037592 [Homalodisca vitripennis]